MKYILLLSLIFACTSKPPKMIQGQKGVSIESLQLASENHTPYVTEIEFSKGKAVLNPENEKDLLKLYKKAMSKGVVQDVKVVTWADREYPSVHKKELTLKEQKLVKNRNSVIEDYFLSLDPDLQVSSFSMAKRPGYFKSIFSTEEARIKKSLETAGIPNTDSSIKEPRKASQAIVILILKQ